MPRKKKTIQKADIITAYKNSYLNTGTFPESIKTIADENEWSFIEVRKHYENIKELQSNIVISYFVNAQEKIGQGEDFQSFELKDKHLTFMYVLSSLFEEDNIFLIDFVREHKKNLSFWHQISKKLNHLPVDWADEVHWKIDLLKKIEAPSYKSALIKHGLGMLAFWTKDKSAEKEDTDAFIEKSTQVFFQFSDPSVFNNLFDFGKFMFSRFQFSK